MTALPQDVVADLRHRVAELEQRLQAGLAERDEAIARQAAGAVEHAWLLTELRTTRDRQAASAEILRAIADASGDAEQSLQQIAETTARMFGASSVTLGIASGDEWARMIRVGPSSQRVGSELSAAQLGIGGRNLPATVFRENRQIHIPDLTNPDPAIADWPALPHARAAGARALAGTPLRREGKAIGALVVHRDRPVPFTAEELALLQSFADQAVIAIENARLFNETREALEQQKASADILSVISNSVADTQPVFDKILHSIEHLFGGEERFIFLVGEDGLLHIGAAHGRTAERARTLFPAPLEGTASEVAIRERRLVISADIFNDPDIPADARERSRRFGTNYSMVVAPMLSEDRAIGSILVARTSMEPFSEKECGLLQTFADQAVIAIQNVRLLNETREALERQTATADILKVIASSPSDVQPVFEAIATSANRLIGGFSTAVFRFVDDTQHLMAFTPTNPAGDAALKARGPRPLSDQPWAEQIRRGEIVHRPDIETESNVPANLREVWRMRGFRALLLVPLRRDGASIGMITVTRKEPGSFADHHVQLLQTFADQAVIAIENTRLFNETKEALERQTATADILKVIASSPSDVQPVFEAIAASANRLIGGHSTAVSRFVDGVVHLPAFTPTSPAADEVLKASLPRPLADFPPSEGLRKGEAVQLADAETVPDVRVRDLARARGYRSVLFSPLMSNGAPIGVISVTRVETGSFADHHVQLLQTFADQAVIAIENTRLFNETKEALERQTATADILKVIASSPSDVQPVFDAIATSANRLIGGLSTAVHSLVNDTLHLTAFTPTSPAGDAALQASFPRPLSALPWGEQMRNGELVHIPDVEVEGAMLPDLRDLARMRGFRSMLRVPLLRDRAPIGFINVTRAEPGPFAAHHVQLLQTFADQAVIAIENTRLFNETKEALERQTATADILKVIASSPSDVQPVFEAIAERSNRLVEGLSTGVYRLVDDTLHLMAFTRISPQADAVLEASYPRPLSALPWGDQIRRGELVHVRDTEVELAEVPALREMARQRGWRSSLLVPLLRDRAPIGLISVTHKEPGTFAAHHVQLLQTFADQAVIAIENVRLFNETREALERQTATADILKVIASSPSDVQPVFEAIATSANRLIGGFSTAVFRFVDGVSHLAAFTPTTPAADEILKASFPRRVEFAQAGETVQITDVETSTDAQIRDIARARGFRSMLLSPLMSKGASIGRISVTRTEPGSFADHHVQLLQTFADQAVIAIENVRLFDEVQARTEDLRESLQQQTATAEVLKVISRSAFDLDAVLATLVESAATLCEAQRGLIFLRQDNHCRMVANYGFSPELEAFAKANPLPIDGRSTTARAAASGVAVQAVDLLADETQGELALQYQRLGGHRTNLGVPLRREGETIGVFTLTRQEVRPFTEKQIELVSTFADQAVIAISNVRLFEEVQARTEDLRESLQQQTATADVLKVISRSAFDLQTVLDTLTESAARLCNADMAAIARQDARGFYHATNYNFSVDWVKFTDPVRLQPERGSVIGRALLAGAAVQIPDVLADPEYAYPDMQKAAGYRTLLGVPLLRGKEPIGVLFLGRKTVEPFTDKQIELVSTFADQAVIAIENVRLFDEVQDKTRELTEALTYQTGSSNILSVIASSPTDVGPVLKAIVESASELCEAYDAVVLLKEGDDLRFSAHHGPIPIGLEKWPINRNWVTGRSVIDKVPMHVHDLLSPEGAEFPEGQEMSRAQGHRTVLSVPMLREGESIGAIVLRRTEVHPFSDKQIALLQTFADQAVIAIGNVRLFDEVQAKTRDLSESLQQQTATADVLKVISRSAFDLDTVLNTLIQSGAKLCEAPHGVIWLRRGDRLHLAAHAGYNQDWVETARNNPVTPDAEGNTVSGRVAATGKYLHLEDITTDESFKSNELHRMGQYRAALMIPLIRDGKVEGTIGFTRLTKGRFTRRQIELVETFADQAVIAIENARLFDEVQAKTRELSEALTYQTGSSNILGVIASSPTDVAPVLEAIVKSACELCEAYDAVVVLKDGDDLRFSAHHGPIPIGLEKWPISRNWTAGRAFLDQKPVHVRDLLSDEGADFPDGRELSRYTGSGDIRSILSMPLLREGESIGAILLRRTEVQPFSDKQIALLQTFADQAVIAIGNVRLFEEVQAKTRDLSEALQQQTATADVLKVISRSVFDLQAVLDALVESAAHLCDTDRAVLTRKQGDRYYRAALYGFPEEAIAEMKSVPVDLESGTIVARALRNCAIVHVADVNADPEYPGTPAQTLGGVRTVLSVPLIRETQPVGAITVSRIRVEPFTEKQIDLIKTFADQAVIAIENARLFEEVQAKTRELSEALTYQTGSSSILGVIASSPTDVAPVLEAIVKSACELCEAADALVVLKDGDELVFKAQHGSIPVVWQRQPINRRMAAGRAIVDGKPVHVHDLLSPEGEEFPDAREFARKTNVRTVLSVPLIRENESIGSIVLRRTDVQPFSDKQIALLQTFADQAVIAIGNVRLFDEVQAKTRDLTESLQQQTATADVLKVISRSTFDLPAVLQTLVESAARLCDADKTNITREKNGAFYRAEAYGFSPEFQEYAKDKPIEAGRGSSFGRALLEGRVIHIPDVLADPEYTYLEGQRLGDYRTVLTVPMLRENVAIGVLSLTRTKVLPFTDKQIELATTFADQAAIAIENVRLFDSVEARTRELAKSLEDLRTAQDRLVQTEKLASLGQLTAGIAHEIKNPLNFVNNFSAVSAELTDELNDLLKSATLSEKLREEVDELTRLLKDNLEKVVQHGKRADSIVKNMLLHSREGSGEHRPTEINALLDESLNLAYHGARAEKREFNVTLQREFDEAAGAADLFPQEITRAFLNLISNGFYAANKRKKEVGSGFEPVLRAATRDLGDNVEIRIRDNGTGIPPEVKEKMFNPFFTTKPAGEGTGLGLSMSHDIIVKQHGGTIDVDSEPGEYTEFRIVLPRTSNIANKARGQT